MVGPFAEKRYDGNNSNGVKRKEDISIFPLVYWTRSGSAISSRQTDVSFARFFFLFFTDRDVFSRSTASREIFFNGGSIFVPRDPYKYVRLQIFGRFDQFATTSDANSTSSWNHVTCVKVRKGWNKTKI